MNILITGIHSFVDSNLVVALKEHHNLYGVDIRMSLFQQFICCFNWVYRWELFICL